MPVYQQRGRIPKKRHVAFKQADGTLYPEELVGNKGFSGNSSLLYHLRQPTTVTAVRALRELRFESDPDPALRPRHFRTAAIAAGQSAVLDRVPLLGNADVVLSLAGPQREDDFF